MAGCASENWHDAAGSRSRRCATTKQLGLLPEPGRTESGYRSYGEDAVDRLAFIRAAQAVRLTLAEVRQVLGVRDADEPPCRVVTDLIEHRHTEVKAMFTVWRMASPVRRRVPPGDL